MISSRVQRLITICAYFGGAVPGLLLSYYIGMVLSYTGMFLIGIPLLLGSPFISVACGIREAELARQGRLGQCMLIVTSLWGAFCFFGAVYLTYNWLAGSIRSIQANQVRGIHATTIGAVIAIGLWSMHFGALWNGMRQAEKPNPMKPSGLAYWLGAAVGILLSGLLYSVCQLALHSDPSRQ